MLSCNSLMVSNKLFKRIICKTYLLRLYLLSAVLFRIFHYPQVYFQGINIQQYIYIYILPSHVVVYYCLLCNIALYYPTLYGAHNPMGQTEAWYTTDYLTKRLKLESTSHLPVYPQRAGEKDCTHYMQTRTCKFGEGCKFDHPVWVPEGGIPDWKEVIVYYYLSIYIIMMITFFSSLDLGYVLICLYHESLCLITFKLYLYSFCLVSGLINLGTIYIYIYFVST